uniref:Uncharacterized protein n=1 Tax=Geospiza parvula TaxID=87175 RepID=A0A8U8BW61_GEOPR
RWDGVSGLPRARCPSRHVCREPIIFVPACAGPGTPVCVCPGAGGAGGQEVGAARQGGREPRLGGTSWNENILPSSVWILH